MRSAFLIAGGLAVLAAAASGEVVVQLKSGRTLRGQVVEQTPHVLRLRTSSGILVDLKPGEIGDIGSAAGPPPATQPASRARPATRPAPRGAAHSATCPADCPLCERMFRHSLDSYCARVLRRPDAAPIPVRLGAWPALQTPTCCVLGLVLLGEGEALRPGRHQRTVLKLTRYVNAWADREHRTLKGHRTWSLAFAVLLLSELHRAAPSASLRRRILRLVRVLESGRQGDQGWCHTLERGGYGPFVGVTIWCAAALGAAREQGVAVDEKGLAETFAGLRRSIGPTGGASYYSHHRSSLSVGRTAGVAWALCRHAGDGKSAAAGRALNFLLRHVEEAPHGHASGLMSFAWAALAASSFGRNEHRAFWRVHRRTLLEARRPGGTFAVQPWRDLGYTDRNDSRPREAKGTTWPDRMYGEPWATAWMLLAWQAARGRCLLARRPLGGRIGLEV